MQCVNNSTPRRSWRLSKQDPQSYHEDDEQTDDDDLSTSTVGFTTSKAQQLRKHDDPTRKASSKPRKSNATARPKTPNAFIIFRMKLWKIEKQKKVGAIRDQRAFLRMASARWNRMSPVEKRPYYDEAAELRADGSRAYEQAPRSSEHSQTETVKNSTHKTLHQRSSTRGFSPGAVSHAPRTLSSSPSCGTGITRSKRFSKSRVAVSAPDTDVLFRGTSHIAVVGVPLSTSFMSPPEPCAVALDYAPHDPNIGPTITGRMPYEPAFLEEQSQKEDTQTDDHVWFDYALYCHGG